ncbi:MAG: ribosome small subunit-dependent GTPase A [bacterium]
MQLEDLGFNPWFQNRIDTGKIVPSHIARVITVNKDNYLIKNESSEVLAEITGRLMFRATSPLDYPTVGDWVLAQYFDNDSFAVIDKILPRKTVLKRKTSGKTIDYQLIAANIDAALIIQSLDSNYNLRRLERYLTMVNESNIQPIVLLSKSDLLSPTELRQRMSEINNLMPHVQLVTFSNLIHSEVDRVRDVLISGQTYCLLGSSGVGKTTLLNNLLGKDVFETRAVRKKDSKGRHTTARRQLIILSNGAMLVDTPGMRELGNIGAEIGLEQTFDEIAGLSGQCRYNDCSHTNEDGCAILAGLTEGIISKERYESYMKMSKESAYYEMSYVDKRRRDKKFGKMYKSIMKNNVKK